MFTTILNVSKTLFSMLFFNLLLLDSRVVINLSDSFLVKLEPDVLLKKPGRDTGHHAPSSTNKCDSSIKERDFILLIDLVN